MDDSPKKTENVFALSKNNVNIFLSEVKKTSPQYSQSIVKLQQEYIEAWKTMINSAISLEQEFVSKTGFLKDVPESVLQTIHDLTEISIQAYRQQNEITINSAEETQKVFTAFNENTQSFASLNKEIMGYLMSVFEQKSKT